MFVRKLNYLFFFVSSMGVRTYVCLVFLVYDCVCTCVGGECGYVSLRIHVCVSLYACMCGCGCRCVGVSCVNFK